MLIEFKPLSHLKRDRYAYMRLQLIFLPESDVSERVYIVGVLIDTMLMKSIPIQEILITILTNKSNCKKSLTSHCAFSSDVLANRECQNFINIL